MNPNQWPDQNRPDQSPSDQGSSPSNQGLIPWCARPCEGWNSYIESTYGIGESVEDSSAVHNTETLVVSDDEEAPGAQATWGKILLIISIIPITGCFSMFPGDDLITKINQKN